MPSEKMPAVSGLFYTADAGALLCEVRSFLDDAGMIYPVSQPFVPKALIVPHAGYIYSGLYAAVGYQSISPDLISRVVLLGPSHRVPLRGMALSSSDIFRTPLGGVRVMKEGVDDLLKLPCVAVDDEAHADEHCLEVQLPFLQTILNDFEILPIVVGLSRPEDVASVLSAVWGGRETLIVVSSDLSHYHSYKEAGIIDKNTSKKIANYEADIQGEEACGCYAVNGLLFEAERRGLSVETLVVANSGDSAGGKQRVVGYGAYAFG